jgi:hypothetical protein
MKYERIMKTDEMQEIIKKYQIENYGDINYIGIILSSINIKEGENLLLKHFDFNCKDRIMDYIDGKNSKEEAFLIRNVYKCFDLATPRFYNTFMQMKKTINERSKDEENFIKECFIFENSNEEVGKCLGNKLKQYMKLIDYDLNVYMNDLEEFKKEIYL